MDYIKILKVIVVLRILPELQGNTIAGNKQVRAKRIQVNRQRSYKLDL